jgi:hypothetical protein
VASKVLKTQLTVDDFQTSIMDSHQLKEFVERNLFAHMTDSIMKEMTIENVGNPNTGVTTYTGTLNVGASTINGSSYSTTVRDQPRLNLRVVEFTKNGKVTKVELQHHIEGAWLRVPRIQIEEK